MRSRAPSSWDAFNPEAASKTSILSNTDITMSAMTRSNLDFSRKSMPSLPLFAAPGRSSPLLEHSGSGTFGLVHVWHRIRRRRHHKDDSHWYTVDNITSLDDVEAPIHSSQGARPALRVRAHPIHFGIGNSRTIIGMAVP